MEWPSQSIPHGGIFHPAKVNYSTETKDFLKLLMNESHLNNNIRQKINYTLRTGEPLPGMYSERGDYKDIDKYPPVILKPGTERRRTLDEIIQSGAYEREKFIPDRSKEDREALKARLQNIMANGRNLEVNPSIKKKKSTKDIKDNIKTNKFDELMQEIKERQDWLDEMEALGEAYKHRDVINLQIQAKLREMDKLKAASLRSEEKSMQ